MPDFSGDIKATLSFSASYRKFIENDHTITEADDKVWLYKGKVEKVAYPVLIKEKEYKPNSWSISMEGVAVSFCNLKLRGEPGDKSGTLLFKDYQSTKNCWEWLTNSPEVLSNESSLQNKELSIFFPGKRKTKNSRKKPVVTLYQ